MLKINDCQAARRGLLEIWCDTFKVKTGTGGVSVCVCACGGGVEGWVFSLAALRYTGAAMESSVELLPSKDIMVREKKGIRLYP